MHLYCTQIMRGLEGPGVALRSQKLLKWKFTSLAKIFHDLYQALVAPHSNNKKRVMISFTKSLKECYSKTNELGIHIDIYNY